MIRKKINFSRKYLRNDPASTINNQIQWYVGLYNKMTAKLLAHKISKKGTTLGVKVVLLAKCCSCTILTGEFALFCTEEGNKSYTK